MNTAARITDDQTRNQDMFSLVCPTKRGAHWKDRISQFVAAEELTDREATIFDVLRAVEFMTATRGRALHTYAGDRLVCDANGRIVDVEPTHANGAPMLGYVVVADGYRAGPAGDH